MTNHKINCDAIFTVTGEYPEITYVDRDATLTRQLTTAISQHRVVIIRGLSKSGKTLLVQHTLRYVNVPRIWLSGDRITSVKSFWKAIVSALQKHGVTNLGNDPEDIAQVLAGNAYCVIVDDFHYIGNREVRGGLSRTFKGLSELGIPVFVVGVQSPPMREIEELPDLIARSLIVTLESWSEDELSRIGHQGFTNCGFGIANIGSLAQESFGSPFLMQKLCQIYCRRRLEERADTRLGYIERVDRNEIDSILRETANSISYMTTYELLTSPPALATNFLFRRHDETKFGNINQLVLYAMSGRYPFGAIPFLEVHVSKLWQRLRQVVLADVEISLETIATTLDMMSSEYRRYYAETANLDDAPRFDPVIDQVGQIFYIRDPFLLFYLRHSDEVEAQFGV